MMRGFLHYYCKDTYGIRPVARELNNPPVWLRCEFDRSWSRDAVDCFLTDSERAVKNSSKCYDPTAEEYYYGFDYMIVSADPRIPIAAEFTESKQASEKTAIRVIRDAPAVETQIWMLRDSVYDTLDWYDHPLSAGVVAIAPYNPRNTDDPPVIRCRAKDRIEKAARMYSESSLSLTRRITTGQASNEPTTQSKTTAPGTSAPEAASTHEPKCS